MKPKLHTVIIATLFFAATPALAEEKAPHAQQDKFSHCAHESKGLKGEERNKFMSDCLKSHDASSPEKAHPHSAPEKAVPVKEAHQEAEHHEGRMKACNDEAHRKDVHGDDRRAFMSACLKVRD